MTQSVPPDLRIAMCESVAECHACEDLQTAVWGGGEREIIPYDILRAIGHAGGTVLGAWDGARIVGMALSFVAWGVEGAYHHSHLLGVLPEHRRSSVGWRLKMAQRDAVLAQGLERITWTFDPLESANAHLNFAKLGVISDTYLPDFYGAMPEALNAGMPSDRLLVTWLLRAPHVLGRLATAQSGMSGASALLLVSAESFDAPYLLHMDDDGFPSSPPSLGREGGRGVKPPPHRNPRRHPGNQSSQPRPGARLAHGEPRRLHRCPRTRLPRDGLPRPPLPPPGMRLLSPLGAGGGRRAVSNEQRTVGS